MSKYSIKHTKNENNICMLDIRSKYILKNMVKESGDGTYKIVDINDLISYLPKKVKADNELINQTIKHLENGGYISVKYSDDDKYCLCPTPFGRQIVENELTNKRSEKHNPSYLSYFLMFIFAFLGAFLGTIIFNII